MQKFIIMLYQFIAKLQKKRHEKRMAKLKQFQKANTSFKNGSNKIVHGNGVDLKLNSETERKKKKMETDIKTIVKAAQNNPEILLGFVEEKGTPVHKIANAKNILKAINEEEGFISPLKGLKALYLSLMLSFVYKKPCLSLKTTEMFVINNAQPDIYHILHQFHKWYAYSINMPGYDHQTQEKFKHLYKHTPNNNITNLSMAEIYSLKEAIARDIEASNFVINLAKEYEGAKNALKKVVSENGASI